MKTPIKNTQIVTFKKIGNTLLIPPTKDNHLSQTRIIPRKLKQSRVL